MAIICDSCKERCDYDWLHLKLAKFTDNSNMSSINGQLCDKCKQDLSAEVAMLGAKYGLSVPQPLAALADKFRRERMEAIGCPTRSSP